MSIFKRILRQVRIVHQVDKNSLLKDDGNTATFFGISDLFWQHPDIREIQYAAYSLAHHEDLKPVFRLIGTSQISWETMDKTLSRLVQEYGEALQKEATSKREATAACFIRQHAKEIASRAIDILVPDETNDPDVAVNDSGPMAVDERLAHWLTSSPLEDEGAALPPDIPVVLDICSDVDPDIDEGPIELDRVEPGFLAEAARFAFSTKAFQNLKQNLAIAIEAGG